MTTQTPMLVGLEGEIATSRQELIELINGITQAFLGEDDASSDDRRKLQDIAQDLRDMFFLVVVVGEFNSGKSTFINALLGDKMLKMGATPTTEHVEMIRYSEKPIYDFETRADGVRVWGHPNTGSEGVAIVDTPGTGSVFAKHEKAAKSFLHRSDLVIFILSAKQAFAETERQYMELVKAYGKKLILVINQVDLLSASERQEVSRFVKDMARETLNIEPLIFEMSARNALETGEDDGLNALKAHLRGVYLQTPPAKQKLLSEIETVERILGVRLEQARQNAILTGNKTGYVRTVEEEIDAQALSLDRRLATTLKSIEDALEGVRQRGARFIDQNLSIRWIGRTPSKDAMEREFREVVLGRTERDINELANNHANNVVDQSRAYWNSVIERLNKLQDLLERQKEGFDAGIYAEQRENLERAIRVAEEELQANMSSDLLSQLRAQFDANMNDLRLYGFATFGGVLMAGLALVALLPGGMAVSPVVVPALILGSFISAGAGIPTYQAYKRAIVDTRKQFNDRIDALLKSYKDNLDDVTRKERNRLTEYGKQQLVPIFSRLEGLTKQYQAQQETLELLQRQLEALRKRVQAL